LGAQHVRSEFNLISCNCMGLMNSSGDENAWQQPETELVSGSSDNLIVVWKLTGKNWEPSSVLKGHTDAVTSVSVLVAGSDLWVASTSSDRTVRLWRRTRGEWKAIQVIEFGPKMMECVSLIQVPKTEVIMMAVGGVEPVIHLFVGKNDKFHKLLSLQGHEDWIRALSFVEADNGDLLLASSSQDNYIRLWRVRRLTTTSSEQSTESPSTSSKLPTSDETENTKSVDGSSSRKENTTTTPDSDVEKMRGNKFRLDTGPLFIAALESVLHGHDDWVYSVCWQPPLLVEGGKHQPMCLLSASMDRTMLIWRPEEETGVWLNEVRVGEMGGNTLGFYGGLFGPHGTQILAHGYNGALHLWEKQQTNPSSEGAFVSETWNPGVTVSGHFGPVMDVMWDPSYQYLVSVSKDQTARLFAPWRKKRNEEGGGDGQEPVTWHEIARPQIHGFDLSCLTFVNGFDHRYVSGADEKVLRVFDAPRTFVASAAEISGIESTTPAESRPLGANIGPLALSNKPVFTEQDVKVEDKGDTFRSETVAQPIFLTQPPFEEQLMQNTLWPEIQKLYGHGDNVVCIACNYSGTHIVSACKGTRVEQCGVIVWETATWKRQTQLLSHVLTVTQVEFSHDDRFLLSVSRDRSFCVFSMTDYKLVFKTKAHDRIIWGCSWSPDDAFIATASRDKKIKIWKRVKGKTSTTTEGDGKEEEWTWVLDSTMIFKQAVTAVTWLPDARTGGGGGGASSWEYVLAVGFENGIIALWSAKQANEKLQWSALCSLPPSMCHVDVVKRMRWRRAGSKSQSTAPTRPLPYELATCGADHSVRIFRFNL
jgi:elongator complex protein 2